MSLRIKIIITAVVLALAGFVLWIFSHTPGIATVAPDRFVARGSIPPFILENYARWDLIASSLRILQIALGVIGTAAALLVTTFTSELEIFRTKVLTFIAAFCLGTLTAFDIGGKANQTRDAWRELTVAIINYQNTIPQTSGSLEKLIAAYKHAEEIVGGVDFRRPDQPSQPTPGPQNNEVPDTTSVKKVSEN